MNKIVSIDGRVWRRVTRIIDERYEDPKRRKGIQKIARRYLSGGTCTAIADEVGLTAERVRQILRALGISRVQGGVSLRTARRQLLQDKERLRKLERTARRNYRCSHEEVERVLAEWRAISPAYRRLPHWSHRSPLHRFRVFHASASRHRRRRVALTLPEWWAVWKDSGHWKNYGRGRRRHHMEVRNPTRPVDIRNVLVTSSFETANETAKSSARRPSTRRKAIAKPVRKVKVTSRRKGRIGRGRRA